MKRILILWLFLLAWAGVLPGSAGADDLSAPNPSAAEVESDQPRLVVQMGHSSSIELVTFTPDGRTLISQENDSTVKLWDVVTGREVRTLRKSVASYEPVVALAPDGRVLASVDQSGTVKLWDVATGREVRTLRGHEHRVESGAFAPDGRTLAAASEDVTLWDVATGREVRTLRVPEGRVESVAFAPDGRTLAAGGLAAGGNGTVILWDVATGREVRTLRGHEDPVCSVAFAPDGRTLASASEDGTVKLWDVATGRKVHTLRGHGNAVTSVTFVEDPEEGIFMSREVFCSMAFAPDGQMLASGDEDGTVKLWDVAMGREVRTLRGHRVSVGSVAFTPDGRMLASGGVEGSVKLWDVATGREVRTLRRHGDLTDSMAFTPDGRLLSAGESGTVKLWDLATGQEVRTLRGHGDPVESLFFALDGRTLAAQGDGTVTLWDLATGRKVRTLRGHGDLAGPVAFAPGGRTLVAASENGIVKLWNVATGREVRTLRGHEDPVDSVAFAPDGRTLAAGGDGTVTLWDVATGRKVHTLRGGGMVCSVAFAPDGRTLATGGDGTVTLWDVATGREMRTLRGHEEKVYSVAFAPDGRTLASASWDTTVKLWDVATGREVRTLRGHERFVNSVAFAPDGRTLASLGHDGIRLWRVADGAHLATLISLTDGSWVITDPAGRFDTADLEEIQGVHWVMPDDPLTPVPIEAFMKEYYEPGLLPRILNGETFPPIRSLLSLNRVQPVVKIAAVQRDNERDTVTVTVEVAKATRTMLRNGQPVPVTTGVHDLKLFRDGQLVGFKEGALLLDESGKATITFTDIRLPRQSEVKTVEFAAYAFNDDGVKSPTHRTPFTLPADLTPVPGKAYLITIGVNRYQNPRWNLNYAAPDAEIIRRMLEARLPPASGYRELISITLTDEQATKANLKSLLDRLAGQQVTPPSAIPNADRLRQATPQDLLILSFSGHGYVDERGIFYAFTHDIGVGADKTVTPDLLGRALSSDELSQWLRNVDAGNMVMIVDACHSAATVGERFKPGPMGSRGLGQLAYDKGMRILAASQADDVALESNRIQHGLLTYALARDGLEAFQADFQPVDQRIALREWLAYGVDRVPKLYEEVRSGQVSTWGRGEQL